MTTCSIIPISFYQDGSGTVEIDEMVEIVGNLFELEGLSKVIQNTEHRVQPNISHFSKNGFIVAMIDFTIS